MLFNSYEFIFVFLPLTFFIFAFSKLWEKFIVPIVALCLLSIVFYGYWNYRYTILIITSIFVNYCIGVWLSNSKISSNLKKTAFIIGVTFNLSLLSYFKYSGFIGNILYDIGVISLMKENVVLPLAISFFTFQQISYLADIYHSRNDQVSLSKYFLFVAFFPQLIAGPIVYFHEIIPQFGRRLTSKTKLIDLQVGSWIFSVGLFKKVIIADTLSMDVDDIFFWSYKGIHPTIFEAWIGALGYTFQIYFDFSGYSDMAVGLARLSA